MNKPLLSASDMAAVATVLSVRLPMLALGAMLPSSEGSREARRMVSEKADAAVAGFMAAQTYWAGMPFSLWKKPMDPNDLYQGAIDAYMAPGRKTLQANAHRLSRRGR